MENEFLFTCTLPVLGGLLLALLLVDLAIGKRDRTTRRSRIVLMSIVVVTEGGLIIWRILHTSHPDPFITQPRLPLISDPPGETALATEAHLNGADIPAYDPAALPPYLAADVHDLTPPASPAHYQVGDRRQFLLRDRFAEAELIHVNGSICTWLVVGVEADRDALGEAVDRFAAEVMPSVRQYFGPAHPQEGDATMHILNYSNEQDGMYGFFDPDTGTLHVNLAQRSPEQASYTSTLAHELQHALQWQVDPNEERWLDEGFSELAPRLVDLDPGSSDESFRDAFDTQLNHWPYEGEGMPPAAHYGASYRFVLYLWERFGDDLLRDLSHHPANGLPSVDAVLADHGTGLTADGVFADWVLANAVDQGEYAYDHEEWEPSLPTWVKSTFYRYPMDIETAVHPYAADYYKLENAAKFRISFSGATQARLLPEDPHSGETCWWSNTAHYSHAHLTHSFDLSRLSEATLRFWMWYDIASKDSYVYLSASRDDGQTWAALQGQYGGRYTGRSNGWVEEMVDLGSYAGDQVLVRFDYVTQHSIHDKGFLLDDLSIPELGIEDACEESGNWQSEGFLLAGPMVPVRWTVQVIDIYREGHSLQVQRMSLDEQQTGEWDLELRPLGGMLGNAGRGILVVAPLVRGTTEPLPYHCEIIHR